MKLCSLTFSTAVVVATIQPPDRGHLSSRNESRVLTPVLEGQKTTVYDADENIENGTLVAEFDSAAIDAMPHPSTTGAPLSTTFRVPGIDMDFPDGQLSCSTFPSNYGAVPVSWLGLDGWTGIQFPASSSPGGFSDIVTKIAGDTCENGDYCSYACPPGYEKTQWPTTQGASGQSVGGLLCQSGKLQLTNPSLSLKLCMKGTQQVEIQVQNNLSQNVAVCRTDYPGTEGETIPLNTIPGQVEPLTCPDASRYYKWQGHSTSAQYYVNPAGVSVEDACQWGSPGNPWGNYAPLNIGAGWNNGTAWLSVFPNSPTTEAKLPFTVTIQGNSLSGTCRYSDGLYCSGSDYRSCNPNVGCTVGHTAFPPKHSLMAA